MLESLESNSIYWIANIDFFQSIHLNNISSRTQEVAVCNIDEVSVLCEAKSEQRSILKLTQIV